MWRWVGRGVSSGRGGGERGMGGERGGERVVRGW